MHTYIFKKRETGILQVQVLSLRLTGRWCNGSMAVSNTADQGSSPCLPAISGGGKGRRRTRKTDCKNVFESQGDEVRLITAMDFVMQSCRVQIPALICRLFAVSALRKLCAPKRRPPNGRGVTKNVITARPACSSTGRVVRKVWVRLPPCRSRERKSCVTKHMGVSDIPRRAHRSKRVAGEVRTDG